VGFRDPIREPVSPQDIKKLLIKKTHAQNLEGLRRRERGVVRQYEEQTTRGGINQSGAESNSRGASKTRREGLVQTVTSKRLPVGEKLKHNKIGKEKKRDPKAQSSGRKRRLALSGLCDQLKNMCRLSRFSGKKGLGGGVRKQETPPPKNDLGPSILGVRGGVGKCDVGSSDRKKTVRHGNRRARNHKKTPLNLQEQRSFTQSGDPENNGRDSFLSEPPLKQQSVSAQGQALELERKSVRQSLERNKLPW